MSSKDYGILQLLQLILQVSYSYYMHRHTVYPWSTSTVFEIRSFHHACCCTVCSILSSSWPVIWCCGWEPSQWVVGWSVLNYIQQVQEKVIYMGNVTLVLVCYWHQVGNPMLLANKPNWNILSITVQSVPVLQNGSTYVKCTPIETLMHNTCILYTQIVSTICSLTLGALS